MLGSSESAEQFVYQGTPLFTIGGPPLIFTFYYNYAVHPAYHSDSAIRLTRRPLPHPLTRSLPDNPYLYKPKSYSRKREPPQDRPSPAHTPPPPNKKFRPSPPLQPIFNSLNTLDSSLIETALRDQEPTFFSWPSGESFRKEGGSTFRLPLGTEVSSKARRNPQLSNKIEIVSTDNSKLLISIHEGLLRANTNHSKQEQSLEGIANPFNARLKTHFSNTIPFIREYRSGYAPIELQSRSKR